MRHLTVLSVVALMTSACGGGGPAAPTPRFGDGPLVVTCSTVTLLAGDLAVCAATTGLRAVTTAAMWESSDQRIATSLGSGLFLGRADGEATVTATYSGQSKSARFRVHLEDVLRITASSYSGTFTTGSTVTFWLQGFYGVASAASGTLTMVIEDQNGTIVHTSEPLVASHGGDRYLISTSFTLPPGTTRVCRAIVLKLGPIALTADPPDSLTRCFAVNSD